MVTDKTSTGPLFLGALRYPGGKQNAIKTILPLIPTDITHYREPFLGGGSVFYALRQSRVHAANLTSFWLNDLNQDLIYYMRVVQYEAAALVLNLKLFKSSFAGNGRGLYEYLKTESNIVTDFDRALRFFIMNRITFSGVMDAGGYSQNAFEKRFTDSAIDRVAQSAAFLKDGVYIGCQSYEGVVSLSGSGDTCFIFADPPYLSATKSRLYGPKGELHTSFDHERFAYFMCDIVNQDLPYRWLITYDDCPEIRRLFNRPGVHIREWKLQYGMNNVGQPTAAKGNELLISNYPLPV